MESTGKKHNLFEQFQMQQQSLQEFFCFIIALLIVIVWGISGPLFHYSETWQLVINTGTTIITF